LYEYTSGWEQKELVMEYFGNNLSEISNLNTEMLRLSRSFNYFKWK